jgi:hypothetical protein
MKRSRSDARRRLADRKLIIQNLSIILTNVLRSLPARNDCIAQEISEGLLQGSTYSQRLFDKIVFHSLGHLRCRANRDPHLMG